MAKGALTKDNVASCFGVCSTYIGAMVGPAVVAGSYAVWYFAPYGVWALVLPFLSMLIGGALIGFGAEIARRYKVYDYGAYSRVMYGKYKTFLSPILELYVIGTLIVGGATVLALSGPFTVQMFHISGTIGITVICIISIILTLSSEKVVRIASSVMTVLMVACLVILGIYIYGAHGKTLIYIIKTAQVPEGQSFASGVPNAIIFGFTTCMMAISLSSVEQGFVKKSQSVLTGIMVLVIGGIFLAITASFLIVFLPDILAEEVPVLWIINTYFSETAPWIINAYILVMFVSIISTMVPHIHILGSRWARLIPAKGIMKKEVARKSVIAIIYCLLCFAVSAFGLTGIISVGYTWLSYLAMPLIALPILIIWPIKWTMEKKKAQSDNSSAAETHTI